METAALIASCVSGLLAFVAIGLAITFYVMTDKISRDIRDASKDISSGVGKLETLFNRLYADTFGMMKDTMTAMRKQLWPESRETESKIKEESEKESEEKLEKIKTEFKNELNEILNKQKISNKKAEDLSDKIAERTSRLIEKSSKVKQVVRKKILRRYLLNALIDHSPGGVVAEVIVGEMGLSKFGIFDILEELKELKKDKLISWEGEELNQGTILWISEELGKKIIKER